MMTVTSRNLFFYLFIYYFSKQILLLHILISQINCNFLLSMSMTAAVRLLQTRSRAVIEPGETVTNAQVLNFQSSVVEDYILLGCDAVLLGNLLSDAASYPTRTEFSVTDS